MNQLKLSIALFSLSTSFYSCSNENVIEESPETKKDSVVTEIAAPLNISEDVEATKFKELIESGQGLLLDVRTPEEFSEGNIIGSVNLNFNGADFETSLDSLDKTIPVYVYCQAGGRSGKAKDLMLEKGFTEVYNLIGGFGSWPY